MVFKKISLLALPIMMLVSSCNTSTQETNNTDDLALDSLKTITDSLSLNTEDEERTSYKLPSALQIAYVAKKSGATYNISFLNKTENASKYNTSNYKRAANFGIYSADLANCLFNKKYQESKKYLKALKEMGSYLGLNQAFESDNFAERFDKNIANEDTIVKIVSNVQLKTDQLFEQNKQKHITVIAFAGAWVESLSLALESYSAQKNKKVIAGVCDQIMITPTLIKAIDANLKKEPEFESLLKAVTAINTQFNEIPSVKAALDKDEDVDFATLTFTDADVKGLSDLVKNLRTEMIN